MHHYNHHIGDFRSATCHLSDAEELAYRRMLELYYDLEGPLPADIAWIARRVRSTTDTVQQVLHDFFEQDADSGAWRQSRCDDELAAYQAARARAAANGRRGGRPPNPPAAEQEPGGDQPPTPLETDQEPSGNPAGSERVPRSKAPHTPIPVPQSPVPSTQPPPGVGSGAGLAPPPSGIGERGDPAEVEAVFALLGATPLRSNSRNRRTILHEHAGALVADGLGSDQCRRLIAKARAESRGDYGGLLATWLKPGHWREQWGKVLSGNAIGIAAGVAARRRAQ